MKIINSAGILFLHLIGEKIEGDKINIHHVNSYKNALNFYDASKNLHDMMIDDSDIELFCILGLKEKVEKIINVIKNQMGNNIIKNQLENNLDFLENNFLDLINEYLIHNENESLNQSSICIDDWIINIFWKKNKNSCNDRKIINSVIENWLLIEKPILMGKQIIIQSFQLADLNGRKIIGIYQDKLDGEWFAILEDGFKLKLNSEIPYMRQKVGENDFNIFTIGDVDSIINNPIYAYGKYFKPVEIYEEWNKIFLYVAALKDCEWNIKSIKKYYEKFLEFIEQNICDVINAESIITKDQYCNALCITINRIKEFLKGKEETVISKELWLLLNSRYIYLPYIYDILEISFEEKNNTFCYKEFTKKLNTMAIDDNYKKGLDFEELTAYFINNIPGLKITGRRVKTGTQEIDLSAINISLDNNLWEMGAYILIECKNWNQKVDISVIRQLSHISELKGNKTTILFSANGITKDAENEIIRTAINGKFIINITKEELNNIIKKEDCYKLLLDKWNLLEQKIDSEQFI